MNIPPRRKSPRAPSIDLADAVSRAEAIYERERRHHAPADVAAQAIGYKSANNGTALSVLASLRYFGLLERSANGLVAVTKEVEQYKFTPSEELRHQLLVRWLKTPPLFVDLLEKYAEGLPSDATLRFDLIQRGFSPSSAESALAVFRRSVEYVKYFDKVLEPSPSASAPEDVASPPPIPQAQDGGSSWADAAIAAPELLAPELPPSQALDRIPVRLSGGRRAWLEIPSPFFLADKRRLKAQIDLLLADDDDGEGDQRG